MLRILFPLLVLLSAQAAARATAPEPEPRVSPKVVREWAKHHLGKKLQLQVLSLGKDQHPFALLIAYQRLPDWNPDTVVPEDVRGGARIFVFTSSEPVEIHEHGFLSPDPKSGRERPYVNCDEATVYYLSERHDPIVVAQACGEQNEYITRFLVFAADEPQAPAIGKATARPGIDTVSPRERFVPGKLPWTKVRAAHFGDGKTLAEGTEFKGKGDQMRSRDYRVEWTGQVLSKVTGEWRPLRGSAP